MTYASSRGCCSHPAPRSAGCPWRCLSAPRRPPCGFPRREFCCHRLPPLWSHGARSCRARWIARVARGPHRPVINRRRWVAGSRADAKFWKRRDRLSSSPKGCEAWPLQSSCHLIALNLGHRDGCVHQGSGHRLNVQNEAWCGYCRNTSVRRDACAHLHRRHIAEATRVCRRLRHTAGPAAAIDTH